MRMEDVRKWFERFRHLLLFEICQHPQHPPLHTVRLVVNWSKAALKPYSLILQKAYSKAVETMDGRIDESLS